MKEFRRRDNPDQKVNYHILCTTYRGICCIHHFEPFLYSCCVFVVFSFTFFTRLDLSIPQYTLAMVGYGDDEMKTTVLELTYNYGVTEYTKGNGYAQVHS